MVTHRRAAVLALGLAATMIVTVVVTSVAPMAAGADAAADKKAQAATLAQRINTQGQQVEILAEQYNGAQIHLAEVRQQLADAEQRLAQAWAISEQERAALATEAVIAYVHGGLATSASMKSFSGSVDLAVQQGYFRLATSNQVDALALLRQGEQLLHQKQAILLGAQRDSQAALASVSSRQQAVQAAVSASQATLGQVQGDLVQLVAQQQDRIAAQQQAQVQARLTAAPKSGGGSPPVGGVALNQPSPAGASGSKVAADATAAPGASAGGTGGLQTAAPPLKAPPVKPSAPPPPATAVPTTQPAPAPPPSSRAGAAIAYARAQLGKPYQWGGAGPGSFDCSGLTMRAWGAAGVSLPHHAASQYANTTHIRIADLQPGDLVFYGSDLHHEGLYVGGGQMIEAPSTGQFVRYASIYRSDLQPFGGRPG